jgi:hypothetical protein
MRNEGTGSPKNDDNVRSSSVGDLVDLVVIPRWAPGNTQGEKPATDAQSLHNLCIALASAE